MKNFDDILKTKLESLDFAYDEQAWMALESELDSGVPTQAATPSGATGSLWAGIAAATVLTIAMATAPTLTSHEEQSSAPENGATNTNQAAFVSDEEPDEKDKTAISAQEVHVIKLVEVDAEDKNSDDEDADQEIAEIEIRSDEIEKEFIDEIDNDFNSDDDLTLSQNIDNEFEIIAKGIQCPGSPVEFRVEGVEGKFVVDWLFNDVFPMRGESVQYSFDEPGQHTVVAIVRTEGTEVLRMERAQAIEIFEKPTVDLDIKLTPHDQCFSQTVTATADPSSNAYHWSVGKGHAQQRESLEFSAMPGTYEINTMAINPEGCRQRYTSNVVVAPSFSIWAPNAFTPDGNGTNDTWLPKGLERPGLTFTLEIYGTDGSLVYKTTEPEPWDGSIRGTTERPRTGDVFTWKYTVKDACNNVMSDGGTLSVIR